MRILTALLEWGRAEFRNRVAVERAGWREVFPAAASPAELAEPEPACFRCGGRDIRTVSNTHVRCAACGVWMRMDGADRVMNLESAPTVVMPGFSGGGPGIVERDWQGKEISRRPAAAAELRGAVKLNPRGFLVAMGRLLGGPRP